MEGLLRHHQYQGLRLHQESSVQLEWLELRVLMELLDQHLQDLWYQQVLHSRPRHGDRHHLIIEVRLLAAR